MRKFELRQNVHRYRRLLAGEAPEPPRSVRSSVMIGWQRDLALLESETFGAVRGPRPPRQVSGAGQMARAFESLTSAASLLHPGPGIHYLEVNEAYARLVGGRRVAGERLFDVLPDNPDDPTADGVCGLYASLRTAASTGRPSTRPVHRYDIRGPDGRFAPRWWRAVHTPVFDRRGRLLYLLNEVEDVTSQMLGRGGAGSLDPADLDARAA